MSATPQDAIDAINHVYGRHDGVRAVHSKGTICKGTFTASPAAAALTRAAHMQGGTVPVTARFSNGNGAANRPDYVPDGRGFAVKFYLPDDSRTDIVSLSLPQFFVRDPDDFVKFTRAGKPKLFGQPGPALPLYLLRHREALPAIRAFLAQKPPPSYAQVRYNALHSFKWLDADGGERWVRYSWLPEAGEASISGGEAKERGRDYLQEEIAQRLASGPVRFTLQVQIAAPGDAIDDPTVRWPDDNTTVDVGTIAIDGLETGRDTGGDVLVFDPTRVTDGIALSGDKILRFRSPAYSISIERRSGIARPEKI